MVAFLIVFNAWFQCANLATVFGRTLNRTLPNSLFPSHCVDRRLTRPEAQFAAGLHKLFRILALFRADVEQTALSVEGVAQAVCVLTGLSPARRLSGIIQLTLTDGSQTVVSL